MGISIQDIIDNKWIDNDIISKIPRICDGCGEELEITDDLRNLKCKNDKCSYKIAYRLKSMLNKLKISSLTEDECKQLCKDKKMISPFQIMILDGNNYDKIEDFNDKLAEIKDRLSKEMYLWEMVELASIDDISVLAKKMFDGYCFIEEAYEDIESMEVPYVAGKLGLNGNEGVVAGVYIYNILKKYKDELKFAESKLNIIEDERVAFRIVIRGDVEGFINKSDYINWLNTKYSDYIAFIIQGCVTENTDLLINNDETSNIESKLVKSLNNVNDTKEIRELTSKEFNEFISKVYDKLKETDENETETDIEEDDYVIDI